MEKKAIAYEAPTVHWQTIELEHVIACSQEISTDLGGATETWDEEDITNGDIILELP